MLPVTQFHLPGRHTRPSALIWILATSARSLEALIRPSPVLRIGMASSRPWLTEEEGPSCVLLIPWAFSCFSLYLFLAVHSFSSSRKYNHSMLRIRGAVRIHSPGSDPRRSLRRRPICWGSMLTPPLPPAQGLHLGKVLNRKNVFSIDDWITTCEFFTSLHFFFCLFV